MPVTSQVGLFVGDHDQVERAGGDLVLTPGTEILLGGRIGLDRCDGHPEKIAHAMTAKVARMATTTMRMSTESLS